MGAPRVAIVHGGEEVLTPAQRAERGEGMTNNFYINTSDPHQAAQEIGTILARQARLNRTARV
jgi:hypothetical protein